MNEQEDSMVEITAVGQNKRIKRNEDNLRDLQDKIKRTNIHIIGVPDGEEKGLEKIFEEIVAENFPISHLSPGSTGVPGRINPERHAKVHSNQIDRN